MTTGLLNDKRFTKSVLNSLAKSVLLPLGVSAGTLAADAVIQKKIYELGTLIFTINEEMEDIIKILKSLEESGLLIKGVNETIKNKTKNKKLDFSQCY